MVDYMDVADSVADFETEVRDPQYRPIAFAADSALIRELGERLVGEGYYALAELVKKRLRRGRDDLHHKAGARSHHRV